MKALMFILNRLDEKSTWMGIIGFASSVAGFSFAPEFKEELTTLGVTVATVGIMLLKEGDSADAVREDQKQ
jgi:hypothetical protein